MFTVEVKRKALRRFEELGEKRKKRLKEVITLLKEDAIPFKRLVSREPRANQQAEPCVMPCVNNRVTR